MTEEELTILKNLDPKWQYLHRNSEGDLELQIKGLVDGKMYTTHYDWFTMFNHIFKSVTVKKTIDLKTLKEVKT